MIPLVGNGDDTRVDSCAAVPQTKLYDRSLDTPRRRQMPQLRTAAGRAWQVIPLVGNGDDTRVDSCAAVPQTKLYD
ncbi:hypothetical protein, partial [Micromonospora sp. 4G55]|uniref:hypothetical protein n=1 Tax=Micromonospora sp. 4G55 TaxID=2806102 RepID=UPI001EE46AA2